MSHNDPAIAGGDSFFEYCTTSTGGTNLNLKGSGTSANTFLVSASTAKAGGIHIHDVTFSMLDAGMENGKFGGLAALGTGCQVRVMTSTGGTIKDFTATQKITTNEKFALLGAIARFREPGAGDDQMLMVWHIHETFGHALHMRQGDEFQVVVNDATSNLTSFQVSVHGHYPGN